MIRTLFGVDVDICDQDLVRVAGTGRNDRLFGKKLESGHLSAKTMREQRIITMFNSQNEEPCRDCPRLKQCGKYPRLYFPLVDEGGVHGAISIIAVTAAQSRDLLQRKDNFVLFMQTVCDLITMKIREHKERLLREYQAKLQERLINVIDEGLMILDDQNRVLSVNKRCEKVLDCSIQQIRQLSELRRFSVAPLSVQDAGGRIDYLVKIRRTKIKLSGHVYEVNAADPTKINRIFVFVDIRTLHESLAPSVSPQHSGFDSMIGDSPEFRKAVAVCREAAFSLTPALLVGEVGIGKEMFARAMHYESALRKKQFIRLASGAAMQELIGKSVFSDSRSSDGASALRDDFLEGNSVYIDEVGDLAMDHQRILLDIIHKSRALNTRVLCSTSKSLKVLVDSVDFHPELFYSLDIHAIAIPPLRLRDKDVLLFIDHYLRIANENAHKNVSLGKDAIGHFLGYSWPGNIREVENTITYVVEHSGIDDGELNLEGIPDEVVAKLREKHHDNYNLEKTERLLITRALNEFSSSRHTRADVAKALGISNATLYRKLKQYGIRENFVAD